LRPLDASQRPQRALDTSAQKAKPKAAAGAPQLVSLASRMAAEPPPRDEVRVARLRQAIGSGTYELDPEQIARAVLGEG
jgi:flagellar biosynthesis anti-sigma factor FlgM